MDEFEPPSYIEKLIAAINDGAKAAQLGALAFVAIGLFLLGTSFSATDEDLLLNRAITISQLGGTQVPVALSFGFMPAIFVAVHIYTLIRYDLLAANVRRFVVDLPKMVLLEEDQDRCRHLLANVEFIQAQVAPGASWVFRWTFRGIVAVFPVTVLLLVQLSSLRLQNNVVNIVHHVAIFGDLVLLLWFFRRLNGYDGTVWRWMASWRRWGLPVLVVGFDLMWCRVPGASATTVGPGKTAFSVQSPRMVPRIAEGWPGFVGSTIADPWVHPVDLLLCPYVRLGCRYLSVPGRTLVAKVWDNGSFAELRSGDEPTDKRMTSFDKVVLRDRMLRFADLSESMLFMADLTGAELQGARLERASLQAAILKGASLHGANLNRAFLQGARLDGARLDGATLAHASLQGASLLGTSLRGATLDDAWLQGAAFKCVPPPVENRTCNSLEGASFVRAALQGMDLRNVSLRGASLLQSNLWSALITRSTNLSWADLRWAVIVPMSSEEIDQGASGITKAAREGYRRTLAWIGRSEFSLRSPKDGEGPALHTELPEIGSTAWPLQQRTTDPMQIAGPLAGLLADEIAPISDHAAAQVADRMLPPIEDGFRESDDKLADALANPLGCRLLAHAAARRVTLDDDRLRRVRERAGKCPP